MAETMSDILHPGSGAGSNPDFPHSPSGWDRADALSVAGEEGLDLGDDHWEAVRALQGYYASHNEANVRELHDALDEKFHVKGGLKYLYGLFPGGPVAQGCRIAGLEPPAGTSDKSFGSVV